MKNILVFIVFFTIWVVSSVAQTPSPSEIEDFSGEGLHLYPLGWSSEGRWGTLIGRKKTDGNSKIYIFILDSVTDKVLFSSDSYTWTKPPKLDKFWGSSSGIVIESMDSFRLEADFKTNPRKPSFVVGGIRYTFIMRPTSSTKKKYTLSIESSRGDSKNVYKSPSETSLKRAVLLGVLVSPFEQRALAVIREVKTDGNALYRFSGAHLTLGFSRRDSIASSPSDSLLAAVFNGQERLVRSRLAAGANPDIRDTRGYSVLLIAARLGHWQMVVDLLNAGTSPDFKDEDNRSALHYAAFAGNIPAIRALLKAGANRFAKDNAGQTAEDLTTKDAVKKLFQ